MLKFLEEWRYCSYLVCFIFFSCQSSENVIGPFEIYHPTPIYERGFEAEVLLSPRKDNSAVALKISKIVRNYTHQEKTIRQSTNLAPTAGWIVFGVGVAIGVLANQDIGSFIGIGGIVLVVYAKDNQISLGTKIMTERSDSSLSLGNKVTWNEAELDIMIRGKTVTFVTDKEGIVHFNLSKDFACTEDDTRKAIACTVIDKKSGYSDQLAILPTPTEKPKTAQTNEWPTYYVKRYAIGLTGNLTGIATDFETCRNWVDAYYAHCDVCLANYLSNKQIILIPNGSIVYLKETRTIQGVGINAAYVETKDGKTGWIPVIFLQYIK
jgi:hypothetical protein